MANLGSLSTNYFATPKEGFTTTLASTISSGAATVPLNSITGYTNGAIITLVVDPTDVTKKQAFTGVVDTSGVQVTSVVWTEGTNQTHTTGATVVDYVTATHMAAAVKGILITHDQSGLNRSGAAYPSPVFSGTATGTYTLGGTPTITSPIITGTVNGWVTGLTVPNTVTALGNRSYSLVMNGTDLTSQVSAGMRLKTTRTVAAPTQSTSLNGTTQFYSKTSPAGMTFTDDFVVSAWVKLSAYSASQQVIASRYNGTSGWKLYIDTTGQLGLTGYNAGAANFSVVNSYQSIPLNKWVHISSQLDMSSYPTVSPTTSYVMIDGVDVPASVSRAGTNPTALIQAGNLEVGSWNGGLLPFTGKIAQVAIYSAKVTEANVLATISQGLAGTETSLISAYSFNNSINDLNANANNLTANGSAVATNADSPFGGQADSTISSTLDYAIITKTAFSTNTTLTVQVPEGCTIPTSGGVAAVSYSTQKVPYGFPAQRSKWTLQSTYKTSTTQVAANTTTFYNVGSTQLPSLPVGSWNLSYSVLMFMVVVSGVNEIIVTFSTQAAAEDDSYWRSGLVAQTGTQWGSMGNKTKNVDQAAMGTWYLLSLARIAAGSFTLEFLGADADTVLLAECAYL